MFQSRRYRYNNEQIVLFFTILLVLGVIILTSTMTFCLSGVFIIVMFFLSAALIHSHHQTLIRGALTVDRVRTPDLAKVVDECALKLQPGEIDVFVANNKQINAYTFGISSPKVLVLFTSLFQVMTPGELKFIIGHEMGHVALGHTWLNTILGGMAGIPAPFGAAVLLYTAFRWWNRMCEFSADRAGLLACGDLNLAVVALVKLVAPEIRTQHEFEQALALLHAQEGVIPNRLAETFQSHPMLIRRINQLREYAHTAAYQELQAGVNRNVGQQFTQPETLTIPKKIITSASIPEKEPEKSAEERWPWLKQQDQP
jgi:Zn-dependent protease with chaperone function